MSDQRPSDTYAAGKALSERVNPGMEDALRARYDALVPGMSRTIVDVAYGQFYARGVIDEKTRLLATVAALTALGSQTAPQLKVNIASARKVGATRQEVSEIIFQMALYGGMPAMVNAMNAAIEVFEAEEPVQSVPQSAPMAQPAAPLEAPVSEPAPVSASAPQVNEAEPQPQARLPRFMTAPPMGDGS